MLFQRSLCRPTKPRKNTKLCANQSARSSLAPAGLRGARGANVDCVERGLSHRGTAKQRYVLSIWANNSPDGKRSKKKTSANQKRAIRQEKSVLISRKKRSPCACANCPRDISATALLALNSDSAFGGRSAPTRDRVSIFQGTIIRGWAGGEHPHKKSTASPIMQVR